jgi:LysM repeat protein
VKQGDSLYGIGYKYGVAPKAMVAANPWVNSQRNMHLKVGQQVCIP